MRMLIEEVFLRGADDLPVDGVGLAAMDDGAAIRLGDQWLIVTTDSHVIQPLFFPGGDIGRLAVAGTVNDLTMMGATRLLGLTCGLIAEEGLPREVLERVQASMRETCREAGAPIVAGDTKVMGAGEIDRLVINTAGFALAPRVIRDAGLRAGDRLIVTGTVGDHGLAVMAARNRLELEGELVSDVAPIFDLIQRALAAGGEAVTAMKDPTRGGVASALHEMAAKSGVGVLLSEADIPVGRAARAAGELLGIDPLHVANEGKAILGVRPDAAGAVLAALREHPLGRRAAVIGTAVAEPRGRIVLDTGVGRRLLVEPDGEPLPRIC
jgi:hydrogenase expression/formation protein HypE